MTPFCVEDSTHGTRGRRVRRDGAGARDRRASSVTSVRVRSRPRRGAGVRPEPFVVRRGRGTPLIVVHGNGVDHRLLLPLDDCFEEGGWERIYLDLPGFGATPALPGAGGLPELAHWLVAAVDSLIGSRPFAILANSLGGLLAMHLAALVTDRVLGVALLAPAVHADRAHRALPDASVVERDDALLDTLSPADRDAFTAIATRQTATSWEAFRDHALPGIRAADADAMQRLAANYELPGERVVSPLDEVGPVLIVTGRQDHIVGYRDQFTLADRTRSASYAVIDGAGHNVHLEQPVVVDALVRSWAERVHRGGHAA